MKKKELEKLYKFDEGSECFILDVQLEDYRDAYSDWDFSPFANRDLDEGLIDYLLECSSEIPRKYGLIIEFHILTIEKDSSREEKSIIGMHNYFNYQSRKIKNQKISIIRDVFKFLIVGVFLLCIGFYFNKLLDESLLVTILSEGFYIGGWVMLWEMFSVWFFDMSKLKQKIKQFQRLNRADIKYTYRKEVEGK